MASRIAHSSTSLYPPSQSPISLSSLANMSVVSLLGVKVNNNPAKFTDKYEFEITFECLEQLEKGSFDLYFVQNPRR